MRVCPSRLSTISASRWLRRATPVLALAVLAAASGCASRRGVLDVSFNPPTTYVDGSALAGIESYRVYYATTNVPCPGGPFLTVPAAPGNASRTISTKLTGLRVGELYYVAVTALTTKGAESDCSAPQSARARLSE